MTGGAYFGGDVHAERDVIGVQVRIDPDVATDVSGLPNPYIGLRAYTFDDRESFAGRRADIADMVRPAEPLIFVTGASGCGKSSFVQAGVLPALAGHHRARHRSVAMATVRPSARPLTMLADALAQLGLPADGRPFADVVARTPEDRVNLLVIDQLEELFTVADPGERDALIAILCGLPDVRRSRTQIIATLRSDFLGDLFAYRPLYELAKAGTDLRAMSVDELRESIERPLRVRAARDPAYRGKRWEPELVRQLAEQSAAHPAYLPLLQISLQELWRSGRLTLASYAAMGSTLTSAIRDRAGTVLRFTDHDRPRPADPRPEPDQRLMLRMLLDLVQVSSGTAGRPDSRRRRARADIVRDDPDRARLLEDLVAARLVSSHEDVVDIIHESLIANWDRLQEAIADERLALQHRARFEQALDEWLQHQRSDDYLLVGVRLAEARALAERDDVATRRPDARDLLDRSIARRRAEERRALLAEQQRRDHERALRLNDSLRLASEARDLLAEKPDAGLLLAWEALLRDHNDLSETVFREALGHLPAPTRVLAGTGPGFRIAPVFLESGVIGAPVEDGAVIRLWDADGGHRADITVPGDGLTLVAPAGPERLLSCRDGTLRLHDTGGATPSSLELPGAPAIDQRIWHRRLSVAEDGACLVQIQEQGWLVRITGPDLVPERSLAFVGEFHDRPFPGGPAWDEDLFPPGTTLFRATLDRTGSMIVAESSDGGRILGRDGGLRAVLGNDDGMAAAAVLADGTVVTGRMNGRGECWASDGTPRGEFREADGGLDLFVPAVDPSGTYVATTVNHSGVVDIRDGSGEVLATLGGHPGHVWSVAFSPDAARVATGCDDGRVRVWDRRSERQTAVLTGHRQTVYHVEFHPADPSKLLTVDHSGELRLWWLDSPVVAPYAGHRDGAAVLVTDADATWSSDATTTRIRPGGGEPAELAGRLLARGAGGLAVTAGPATVSFWRDGVLRAEIPATDVGGAVIGPDGDRVLLVQAGNPRLWSGDGRLVADLRRPYLPGLSATRESVVGAGFDGEGGKVAAAARNGMVWIWSTATGDLLASFVADTASPDRVFEVAFDPRGEMIATGVRNEVGLWDWHGKRIGRLPTGGYKVFRVAFSPDGEHIVTIADNPSGTPFALPQLWTRDGHPVATLDGLTTSTTARPVFDPRGRYFCLPDGDGVSVIDMTGATIGTISTGLPVGVFDRVAVSPDGERVAVAFGNGQVRVWSLASRRRAMVLQVGEVGPIAFSPDGRMLLAATAAGPITRHPLDVADLFAPAARRIGRVLTPAECRTFQVEEPLLTGDRLAAYAAEARAAARG